MNPIHGKSWGATQLIFATPNVEVHRIEIVPGGYCSEHFHKAKVNRFYVESGRLDILVWHGTEPDVTHLAAGQMTDVAPGLWHMFKARSAVVAWEIYWAESIASDIERRGIGGVEPANLPLMRPIAVAPPQSLCLGRRVALESPDGTFWATVDGVSLPDPIEPSQDIKRRDIGGVEPAPDGAVYVSSSVPDLEMHE